MILECEIYKNLMCQQSCGCCGHCKKKNTCDSVCGIYKENRDKFEEIESNE